MAEHWLLICDLDSTLLGDEAALERFATWVDEQPNLAVAYASRRWLEGLQELVATTALPEPVAYIGGAGTEIHEPGGSPHPWPTTGMDSDVIRVILDDFRAATLQPERFQSFHKVSYHWYDATPRDLVGVDQALRAAGVAAQVVYSSRRDLDILPAGVSKGTAAAAVAEHLGFAPDHVIVAGEAGHDRSLFEQGFVGIVIGSEQDELRELQDEHVYHARQDHAAGVLEGLDHWMKAAIPA